MTGTDEGESMGWMGKRFAACVAGAAVLGGVVLVDATTVSAAGETFEVVSVNAPGCTSGAFGMTVKRSNLDGGACGFAVTATRMAATQQGIVIAANWWGKAKTIVQVGVIFLLITFPDTPPWLEALVGDSSAFLGYGVEPQLTRRNRIHLPRRHRHLGS